MANETNVIRLKVEGFDAEGRAVPMTGPMLVLLPVRDPGYLHKIVALQEALPAGSIVAAGSDGTAAVELLSHVADEVLVEEARRRWGRFATKDAPPELTLKCLRDIFEHVARASRALGVEVKPEDLMVEVAARVADRVEGANASDAEFVRASIAMLNRQDEIDGVREALEMALDHAPPLAIIRGWTPEEQAAAKAWGWAWFDWAGSGSDGNAPEQPAHLKRALDFLANGTIKLGGAT